MQPALPTLSWASLPASSFLPPDSAAAAGGPRPLGLRGAREGPESELLLGGGQNLAQPPGRCSQCPVSETDRAKTGLPFLLQDDYMEALTRLHITVSKAYKINPEMNFEVFIHKVDGLSDDHKIETQRDIHQRANDDLADAGLEKLHLRQVTFL